MKSTHTNLFLVSKYTSINTCSFYLPTLAHACLHSSCLWSPRIRIAESNCETDVLLKETEPITCEPPAGSSLNRSWHSERNASIYCLHEGKRWKGSTLAKHTDLKTSKQASNVVPALTSTARQEVKTREFPGAWRPPNLALRKQRRGPALNHAEGKDEHLKSSWLPIACILVCAHMNLNIHIYKVLFCFERAMAYDMALWVKTLGAKCDWFEFNP